MLALSARPCGALAKALHLRVVPVVHRVQVPTHPTKHHQRPSQRCHAVAQKTMSEQQVDPWKALIEHEQKGDTLEVVVKRWNKGGLVVQVGELEGFIPFQQVSRRTIQQGHAGDFAYLVGRKLQARVMTVDLQAPRRTIILSERRAEQSNVLKQLKVGSVHTGTVVRLEDYGVFVQLLDVPGVSGLIHKTELSWEPVLQVQSLGLTRGQEVRVKLVDVDPVKCRVSLSIRQLTPDPLKQTLDTLPWGPTGSVPPEIQQLVDRLSVQPGIDSVMITRQAQEAHHVAQELQVFLTKADDSGSDGHTVVARLGPVLQELQLVTSLNREAIKAVLQSAVKA